MVSMFIIVNENYKRLETIDLDVVDASASFLKVVDKYNINSNKIKTTKLSDNFIVTWYVTSS